MVLVEAERWRMPPEMRVCLRRRAMVKRGWAEQLAILKLAGLGSEDARLRARLSVEQNRRARRLLRSAVSLAVSSAMPLTITEALTEAADLMVARAIRLGELRHAGFDRNDTQARLDCTDEEYEAAFEWWRDAEAEMPQPDDLAETA